MNQPVTINRESNQKRINQSPIGQAAQEGAEGVEVLVAQLRGPLLRLACLLQLAPSRVLVPFAIRVGDWGLLTADC